MSRVRPPQPPVQPAGEWKFPQPERGRLDNGLEVMLFRLPGQYVISGHLVLGIPLNVEDDAVEGIATITARTLDEGTEDHPGEEFADLLETEGAGFAVDVSLSGTQVILDATASRLHTALPLFAEAVIRPALAPSDVERHVTLRLAEIEQAQANAAQLASTAFRRAVFDPNARASRMTGGEPERVAAVTPPSVRDFHSTYVGPCASTLILAGDFAEDPWPRIQSTFEGWSVPGQVISEHEQPTANRRVLQIVHRPGSVQADVRLGGFGVDRTHPQWADITIASYAMGGAFLSRLNAVLREELGYTYGARLSFVPLRVGGSYSMQGSFRTEVVADAVTTALRLMDVRDRPFTEQEVTDAAAYYTGVSPLRYATADGVADQAASQVLGGLPDDFVDRNLSALVAVTPASATQAYLDIVDLEQYTLVVVGDADQLAEPLQARGIPVEVVTP
jgi:zinc protease